MPQATFYFPRGFLWGTATSSHQVEGNNTNNNWWAWEQVPGNIIGDQKSGLACDWWGGRWQEDFERAEGAYQNAHRLSIEWSRVQPAADRWDESALDYYRQMMQALQERDMTPLVTLHHFTDPIWVTELGGWENPRIFELFEAYTLKVVEALKEYVSLWVTINEPNVLAVIGHLFGAFPPGKDSFPLVFRVIENLIRAHAASYTAIHSLQPHASVGIALNYRGFKPARAWFPLDRAVSRFLSTVFNDTFPKTLSTGVLRLPMFRRRIPQARNTQDFLGIDYYTQDLVAFNLLKAGELFSRRFFNPDAELSDNGFIANEPIGFFESLKWSTQFKLPVIVTENGVEDSDDHLRPNYLAQHIHQLWRGVNYNLPIKGYFHWTLVDNFEWERGWTQRFGLWELDLETQARRKRPSADLYAAICKENGLSSEMVATYAPAVLSKIFPE